MINEIAIPVISQSNHLINTVHRDGLDGQVSNSSSNLSVESIAVEAIDVA